MDLDDNNSDYEPDAMDLDVVAPTLSHSYELIHHADLALLQLGVDPEHHCVICEGCGYAVHRTKLVGHIHNQHPKSPPIPRDLDAILDSLLVPDQVQRPTVPVTPLPYIPIVQGYMCTAQGCGFAGTVERSVWKNHTKSAHPNSSREHLIQACMVQHVFHNPVQFWPVDEGYTVFTIGDADTNIYLTRLKAIDAKGPDVATVQDPDDPRQTNAFLTRHKWLKITREKDVKGLNALVIAPPSKGHPYSALRAKMDAYFGDIRVVIYGMASVVLRWVNTSEG